MQGVGLLCVRQLEKRFDAGTHILDIYLRLELRGEGTRLVSKTN